MTERSSYFKLGLFVIVATAILLLGISLLGAGALFERSVIFETYMDGSVQGLDVGADVKYRGVRIGNVTAIDFAERRYPTGDVITTGELGGYILLELAIRKEAFPDLSLREIEEVTPKAVEQGLRVRMAISSLTGPAYIEVEYLDPRKFPAPPIDWDPPALYVPSAPSQLRVIVDAVSTILTQLADANVGTVVSDLSALLASARTQIDSLDIDNIGTSASALVTEARASNERLRAILDNPGIDRAIENLVATTDSTRRVFADGESDLQQFVKDLPQISARLRSASAEIDDILAGPELEGMLASLDAATDQIAPAVDDFRRLVRRLDRLVAAEQNDIHAIIRLLHATLDNAEALSEDARSNPSRLLFGSPPPKENP